MLKKLFAPLFAFFAMVFMGCSSAFAGEADLIVPDISSSPASFNYLVIGLVISVIGVIFGFIEFLKIKKLPVHTVMSDVGNTIFETCKTYLIQQGKFLIVLEILIGLCIAFYFGYLQHMGAAGVLTILGWSVIGILGSYGVAWFGIRMNTLANSRTAFASLKGEPLNIMNIPLKAGMSIGVLLVSVELIMMLIILLFVPGEIAGACFIGFAIGESLGASALRVAGGIFTKIADIGSDLMKIQFGIKEDDPRNPGVIADCTGDNAGDSIGPTADGFETYGVTGVALVSFILLGVAQDYQIQLLTWIFVMRFLMIVTSVVAYWINGIVNIFYAKKVEKFDFEQPLTNLVWLTSILSIAMTYGVSYALLGNIAEDGVMSKEIRYYDDLFTGSVERISVGNLNGNYAYTTKEMPGRINVLFTMGWNAPKLATSFDVPLESGVYGIDGNNSNDSIPSAPSAGLGVLVKNPLAVLSTGIGIAAVLVAISRRCKTVK